MSTYDVTKERHKRILADHRRSIDVKALAYGYRNALIEARKASQAMHEAREFLAEYFRNDLTGTWDESDAQVIYEDLEWCENAADERIEKWER